MKKLFLPALVCLLGVFFVGCKEHPKSSTDTTEAADSSDSVDLTKDWKLGVQMWTFHQSPFVTALEKADSAGIKFIEAFPGQPLGGNFQGEFGLKMSEENKTKIKQLLQQKGISLVAFGVVVPETVEEWRRTFEFARDMGIQYITAEPHRDHWDSINTMAGEFNIKIAIHDHPRPSRYDHPDSVVAAMNGRPNIGACADLGHWARNGLDVVECLKTLQGRVIGVHLKDIETFNKIDAHDVILGTGVIKFPDVFSELKRQNFSGMFSIEHEANWNNNVPDVIKNRDYFNEQVSKVK